MARQVTQQLGLTRFIHQGHNTLFNRHGGQLVVSNLYFGIDERRANSVGGVLFQRDDPTGDELGCL